MRLGLAYLEREGCLRGSSPGEALRRLGALAQAWREVQPVARVREVAMRLLRVDELRPAEREGFPVVRPGHS